MQEAGQTIMAEIKDFAEFRNYQERKAAGVNRDARIKKLQGLIRAAVQVEHLTTDERWNEFLTYLSATIQKSLELRMGHTRAILSPMMVDHEMLMAHKIALAKAEGVIEALQWVAGLPKAILENGQIARDFYAEEEKEPEGKVG